MKRKSLVSLGVIAAVTAWGLVSASPASADTGTSLTPPASCAAPPSNPDATQDNEAAFVSLWSQRVEDKAWFSNFVGLSTLPDNIKSEPYQSMDSATQGWLVACLVDKLVSDSGQPATDTDVANYQIALDSVIFGKSALQQLKDEVNDKTPSGPSPAQQTPSNLSKAAMDGMISRLGGQGGVTSASLPKSDKNAPTAGHSSGTAPNAASGAVGTGGAKLVRASAAGPLALANSLQSIINNPIVQLILNALNSLEKLISQIQAVLFTLPVVNLLSTLFYKVCAESPTQPLACSISVPVAVPVPVDVNGDHFPDVLATLAPTVPTGLDFGVQFNVTRLGGTGPLPAHIFFVYDIPFANKRLEFGFDGRASSLANVTTAQVTVKNVFQALTGDVNVQAKITSNKPGAVEALTVAVKDLVGGSAGHPPTEANPMAGAVQFSPMPTQLTMGAHLTNNFSDEDIFTLTSTTPTTVNAVMDMDTTTTTPKTHQEFTALIDQLPTSVTVDVSHNGPTQNISYNASAGISHVQATQTAVPDTSQPGSYTRSVYDVQGVPSSVNVTLTGAQDIQYAASSVIPQVTFSTVTYLNSVLQQEITAQAQGVPANIHVTNVTGDTSTITYDASSVLTSVALSMYDLTQDQTNLTATATGIPKHIQFFMVKSSGLYDLTTDTGISLITATLTRGGDPSTVTVLPDPGVDHATIYKRGTQIGVDFQLSGFKSAHFENLNNKMVLGLGLNPGGQAFDAIADLDSPNVYATAHITQLPSSITITDDATTSTYTYSASSPINAGLSIPDVSASITLRPGTTTTLDPSDDTLSAGITNIPATISLQLDSANSQVNWNASDITGKMQVGAHLSAATLGLPRGIDAGLTITGIPATWTANYAHGNVDFEAPSPGIGSIDAWLTNHGTHETDAGDFLAAYYDQPSGDLDAALHISNLQKAAFTKLTDSSGGGFSADLAMGNHSNFDFFASVNLGSPTVTTKLTASGSLNPLPAQIHLESDGGRIRYQGDTNPTLTLAVGAGDPTGLATALSAVSMPAQGVTIRDGGTASNPAIAADLLITGLPDTLDLNTAAGVYTVGNFNPSNPIITVDAVLNHIVSTPLSVALSQDVGTGPVTFVFGPFVSSTDGDGTHHLAVEYTASRTMGAFNAEVTYGHSDDAALYISNIPGGSAPSLSVNAAFGTSDSVNVDMSQGIDEIRAQYRHVGDLTFGGSVDLTHVPSSVHLKLGPKSTGDSNNGATAPEFTFNASASGMSIDAYAMGTGSVSIVSASAQVSLMIHDMGSTITGDLEGTKLNVTSSPATGLFLLDAAALVHLNVSLDFDAGPFVNRGTLGVDINVRDVHVGFTNFSSIGLDLGVTTGLTGDFASFSFGLDVNVTLTVLDKLDFDFTLPIFGDESIRLVTIGHPDDTLQPAVFHFDNIVPNWHIQTNTFGSIFSVTVFEIPFIISCHVGVDSRPGPGTDTNLNQFTLFSPIPDDGNEPPAYLITPGVFGLSGFLMDVVGFFESPYGHEIKPDIGCD